MILTSLAVLLAVLLESLFADLDSYVVDLTTFGLDAVIHGHCQEFRNVLDLVVGKFAFGRVQEGVSHMSAVIAVGCCARLRPSWRSYERQWFPEWLRRDRISSFSLPGFLLYPWAAELDMDPCCRSCSRSRLCLWGRPSWCGQRWKAVE